MPVYVMARDFQPHIKKKKSGKENPACQSMNPSVLNIYYLKEAKSKISRNKPLYLPNEQTAIVVNVTRWSPDFLFKVERGLDREVTTFPDERFYCVSRMFDS